MTPVVPSCQVWHTAGQMDVEWDTWGAKDVWECVRAYGTKALRCLKLVLLEGGANFTGEKEEKNQNVLKRNTLNCPGT